jgi:ABC-type lipoprotein export system ATPase subunit
MSENPRYPFARFWKCALQVNTDGYLKTYRGQAHGMTEAEYNAALAARCKELGVEVVGIADHGSVDSIDRMRVALEAEGIVVFPGFEIACTEKFHMVCLFPEGTGRDELNRYLGALGLTDPDQTAWPTSKGCTEVSRIVLDEIGGFWYAAHSTNSSGIIRVKSLHNWIDGNCVRAIQIPGAVDKLEHDVKPIVLNTNPDWKRERPVAVINASDVSHPDDLSDPSATCWIKMTRPSFDAFKVAFLDPESRIRLNSQQPMEPVGAIEELRIEGGYLDGLRVRFSGHLDTVIGGRGTGKSTLIECLRYALDLPPKGTQARKQHLEIIKENVGKEAGRIVVVLRSSTQNGKRYAVSRRFGEAPIVRDKPDRVSTMHPRDLLPDVDIYGQNEIFELAQDEASRLRLLERFLPDDQADRGQLDQLQKRLRENAAQLAKSADESDQLQGQVNRLPKMQEQLQGYQLLGIEQKLARIPLLERERHIVGRVHEEIRRVQDAISNLSDALPDQTFISDKAVEGLPNAAQLLPMRLALEKLRTSIENVVAMGGQSLAIAHAEFQTLDSAWKAAQASAQAEIDQALRGLPAAAGRTGPQIGAEYQRLQQEIERIRPLSSKVANFTQLVGNLEQERRNLLAELSDLRAKRLGELQTAAKRLTKRLEGRLRIAIQPEADRSPLKEFLLESKLEGVGEKRLGWIAERDSVSPARLAASIRAGKDSLERDWELTPVVAEALTKLPRSRVMALESLELAHRVNIELNVSHEGAAPVYKALDRLSTGQQCTAILHLLLLDNRDPLVMDQPEDNLDNAFIAERIVKELRQAKTQRQFIFATHNANIPVFGDAEWIGVFTANDSHGSMDEASQGSIDVPYIRDSVATILEGGREAFMQRKAKYEF